MSAALHPEPTSAAQPAATVSAIAAAPYKGLDYFEDSEIDQMVFAGRDGDISEVLARIVTQRALVVYGRSGLGKTSLLLAGIFPRLREQGFQPVYVRALGSPLGNLLESIRRTCDLPPAKAEETVFDLLARVRKGVTIVLVLDQFEEFFIQFREQHRELAKVARGREEVARKRSDLAAARTDFVDLISRLIMDESRDVHVVFSLREDYLAALDDFQRQLPDLFREAYRLLPLTAFGAREAIVQPLIQGHLAYDERLVTRLVNELAEFEFDSTRLQITCLELFRLAKAESKDAPRLKEEYLNELIEARGTGLNLVFRHYMEAAVNALTKSRHRLARTILDALITSENTKRALSREELMELKVGKGPEAEAELQAVLNELCAQKLVRPPAGESGGRYEIIHECLLPEILRWLQSDQEFADFRQARDIIVNNCRGEAWREKPKLLLSEEQLSKLIGPHKEQLHLQVTHLEFLLRGSIYRGAADAGYWADRFGHAQSFDILMAALADANDERRRMAATVANQFKDTDGRLFKRCWQLALEDNNVDVRRAAGKAIPSLATEEQLRAIKAKLRWFETPRPVMELLAEMSEEDMKRAGIGWRWRWPARGRAERRIWRERNESIQERRRTGTWTGIWSGLAWMLICVPLFALLFGWVDNPLFGSSEKMPLGGPDMDTHIYVLAFVTALFLGFTAFLGNRTALAGARMAAIYGEGAWSKAVQRMLIPVWFVLVIAAWFIAYLFNAYSIPATVVVPVLLAGIILLAWMGRRILAAGVQASGDCMRASRATAKRLGWCMLTNMEFFVVLPGLLILPIIHYAQNHLKGRNAGDMDPSVLGYFYVSTLLIGSCFHWIMSMTLIQSVEDPGSLPARPPGFPAMRKAALLGAGLSLLWFGWQYWDSIPMFAHKLADNQGFSGKLSAWPKTSHFLIESTNRLFRLTVPKETKASASDARGRFASSYLSVEAEVLFLPFGKGDLAVESVRDYPRGAILTPLPIVGPNAVPATTNSAVQFVQCDLQWSNSAQAWEGELHGQLPAQANESSDYVKLDCSFAEATLFDRRSALAIGQFTNCVLSFRDSINTNVAVNFDLDVSRDASNPRWLSFPTTDTDIRDAKQIGVASNGIWKVAISLSRRNAVGSNNFVVVGPSQPNLSQVPVEQLRNSLASIFSTPMKASNEPPSVSLFVGVALGNTAADAFAKAESSRRYGQIKDAISAYSLAVQKSPGNPVYQSALAKQLYLAGQFRDALPHAKEAARLAPQDYQAWQTLAHAAQGLREWDEAVHAWEQLVKVHPRYFEENKTGAGAQDQALYAEAKRNAAMKK
jgi:tetratricopeptide (TPR) repeat protein